MSTLKDNTAERHRISLIRQTLGRAIAADRDCMIEYRGQSMRVRVMRIRENPQFRWNTKAIVEFSGVATEIEISEIVTADVTS